MNLFHSQSFSYPKSIALGFFLLISAGTLLLMLPFASESGHSAGLVNSLFTATSASCVTGLVVLDTYTSWSLFGQLVIITLIQVGGLGFLTIMALFSMFLNRRIGLKTRSLMQEGASAMYVGGIVRLYRKILFGTAFCEGIGALLLASRFAPVFGWGRGLYFGIFHSVSAFCNAGFDLMGILKPYSSLSYFYNDTVVNLTICGLIIIGGIGFFVWDDLWQNKFHFHRYRLHTKIVLVTTAALLVGGTALYYFFERGNLLRGMSGWDAFLASFFSAVTPRTAGFNTIDTAALTPASKLLTVILMFVGGSPGSTAGGIKTATLAVVLVSAWNFIRNRRKENIFGRRLQDDALTRASLVIVINASLALGVTLLILALDPRLTVSSVLIETFSAIGTVGMSTGITRDIGTISRLALVFLMYCGRVGSLSFALLFTRSKQVASAAQWPQEKVNIG